MPTKKLVLAYSGGLDTSVAIRWLKDQGWDVIAFTVDLGEKKDLDAIQARALKTGASAAYVADGRIPFLQLFVWPSLQAGGRDETGYPPPPPVGGPAVDGDMGREGRAEVLPSRHASRLVSKKGSPSRWMGGRCPRRISSRP